MITIYRLYLKDESLCYVGSTAKNPWVRFMKHKYSYSGANFSCGSWKLFDSGQEVLMEQLEICYPEDRIETESYWIRTFKKNSVNRYLLNEIDYSTYQKKYQKTNADRLTEKLKCTCGKFVSRKNIATHKKTFSHKKKVFETAVPLLKSKIITA